MDYESENMSEMENSDAIAAQEHAGQTDTLVAGIETIFGAGIFIIDEYLNVEVFNPASLALFEFPEGLFDQDTNLRAVIAYMAERGDFGPGDAETFAALPNLALAELASPKEQYKTYLTMPSGRVLRLSATITPNRQFLISAVDHSEQKYKNTMLDMALEIGCSGFWIVDSDGRNLSMHSKYIRQLLNARELKTVEEAGIWPLFHADDLQRAKQLWSEVVDRGIAQEGTVRIVTQRRGIRWIRFHLHPQGQDSSRQSGALCFFTDTTDSLRQQEDLRVAKQKTEASLKAKNDFLARMSHEIRTPMNGVIGIADALIHHHSDPAITPKLELIQSSAVKILKILDETLDHEKLDSGIFKLNPVEASPTKVVRDVCSLWEQQALKNGAFIRCLIQPNVPEYLHFDSFRYEQCLNNLLSNAVKFSPKGQIDVVLTCVKSEGRPDRLVLAVRDTGIGMTQEQKSHIFDAYSQGDKSISSRFGGTGLGLNITKQIIELMDGTISVKSEIGKGTTFALSFPIDTPSHTQNAARQEGQDSAHKIISPTSGSTGLIDTMLDNAKPEPSIYAGLRILVVDDNATNHMVISSLLNSLVGEIHTANNGQEALSVLDNTEIDIVLMDIHMPVMDGIEATIAIRSSQAAYKDVQIIALTADPQYQQKKLCINIGMDEALAKPVKLNDVLRAIDAVMGNDTGQDARTAA